MPIKTERALMTSFWVDDVAALEKAVAGMELPAPEEAKKVIFSEAVSDGLLHVTIVREHEALQVSGWTTQVAKHGFRYLQAFGDRPLEDNVEQIRQQLGTARSSK